jgi:hypothetical protein
MKESSDIIMVFPLEFSTEIKMARMFLLRHCSFISSGRKIQILIVYNSAFSNFSFKSQITPPKKRFIFHINAYNSLNAEI